MNTFDAICGAPLAGAMDVCPAALSVRALPNCMLMASLISCAPLAGAMDVCPALPLSRCVRFLIASLMASLIRCSRSIGRIAC